LLKKELWKENLAKKSTNTRNIELRQAPSFARTFRAKIKEGRLQKGGASMANPKKEHHHGGAFRLF
jgi:hypothetical protein